MQVLNLKRFQGREVVSSLELTEFLDKKHKHFTEKIRQVLGTSAAEFLTLEEYTDGLGLKKTRPVYYLPERETFLMAMSYSYDLQAKVYDAWQEAKDALLSVQAVDDFIIEKGFANEVNTKEVCRGYQRTIKIIVETKGFDSLDESVECIYKLLKQDKKEHFLDTMLNSFNAYIKQCDGMYVLDNAAKIQENLKLLEKRNRMFARRSRGQERGNQS